MSSTTMVSALPLSISVHANQLDAVEEVCGPALGCAGSDVLGQLLLLVVFGVVAVFVLAAVQRVSEARSAVSEERSRTATEREAFSRFARRVAHVEPSAAGYQLTAGDGAVSAASVVGRAPSDGRLDAVRDAYRETVMSMPHYEEDYAEPIERHLREEFGREVATAVTDGDRLTPELKQVLIDRAQEAASDRDRLIRHLDREDEALGDAAEELTAVLEDVEEAETRPLERLGYRQLADEWNRLGELESRLSRLLAERQVTLRDGDPPGRSDGGLSFRRYLYADLETPFPVLADGAVAADRVKGARSRVIRALLNQA